MRARILLPMLLVTAVIALAFQTPSPAPVAAVIIDPMEHPISMHWKNDSGQVFGNIGALKDDLEQGGRRLLLAMNGGMYTEDQSPLGVYVENGKKLREPITKTKGYGNFYMQPNGVFGLDTKGKAFIRTTAEFAKNQDALFATQSGPMLLVNDTINDDFKEKSTNVNIRNGVGLLPDGKVVFAMTKEPMNFHAFARFFKEQGCTDALYLDGVISRAYMPTEGLQQMGGALGPLIAVME